MRPAPILLAAALLAGCASAPQPRQSDPRASTDVRTAACTSPAQRETSVGWCALPAEVRAFVDDRDACDHFRSEPWPASDADADGARRKEIVEGIRTTCAGTDARLAELKTRYATDAAVMAVLAGFEARIER